MFWEEWKVYLRRGNEWKDFFNEKGVLRTCHVKLWMPNFASLAGWPKRLGLGGDSVGRILPHRCLTLFNYDSNLPMYGTFVIRLFLPADNRGLLCQIQMKDIWIWLYLLWAFGHFAPQQRFLVSRIGTIVGSLLSPWAGDRLETAQQSRFFEPKLTWDTPWTEDESETF